jgi:hypothetical protein
MREIRYRTDLRGWAFCPCFILGAATMASKRARASAVTVIFESFFTPTIWGAHPQTGTLLHGQDTSTRRRRRRPHWALARRVSPARNS